MQHALHQPQEDSQCQVEFQRQNLPLPRVSSKHQLFLYICIQGHLPVATDQVQCVEESTAEKSVKAVSNPGKGIDVLFSDFNQRMVVPTKVLFSNLLRDQHRQGAQSTFAEEVLTLPLCLSFHL